MVSISGVHNGVWFLEYLYFSFRQNGILSVTERSSFFARIDNFFICTQIYTSTTN